MKKTIAIFIKNQVGKENIIIILAKRGMNSPVNQLAGWIDWCMSEAFKEDQDLSWI